MNRRKLQRKARFLTFGQFSVFAAVVLVGGYFLYSLLKGA